MLNANEQSLMMAQKKAERVTSTGSHLHPKIAASRALTAMMSHGGLYSLLDSQMMTARLSTMLQQIPELLGDHTSPASFAAAVGSSAESFFEHLVSNPYTIHSNLMSHIAFPHEGTTYTKDTPVNPPDEESPNLPAASTFIGQFIDHDLTMNAVDLFLDQTGNVQNTASPLIDLDSVFGPRSLLDTTMNPATKQDDLYDDGKNTLRLQTRKTKDGKCYFDLVRDFDLPNSDPRHGQDGGGIISDKRNDENQMLLQVHLLVMRVHNRLAEDFPKLNRDALRIETIRTWQSVLLHDHLPRILDTDTLQFLLGELDKENFGAFFYKPLLDLHTGTFVANLPHEFAIAYRFGHSQLKPRYQFREGGGVYELFDNSQAQKKGGVTTDLRGSQMLPEEHLIDWNFFATEEFRGNRIDGKVTSKVFDLPESAIPDDIKFIGNLVHRNLIRSSQVGLCCGEDLARAYEAYDKSKGVSPLRVRPLGKEIIEPEKASWPLYMQNEQGFPSDEFKTPLWYYILREAQHFETRKISKLGPLGSRLVGEVILGAIYWQENSVVKAKKDEKWTSKVLEKLGKPGTQVTFLDLADYVGPQPADCN
jgi:hypothetical protein